MNHVSSAYSYISRDDDIRADPDIILNLNLAPQLGLAVHEHPPLHAMVGRAEYAVRPDHHIVANLN
jgi:hypothetical protein